MTPRRIAVVVAAVVGIVALTRLALAGTSAGGQGGAGDDDRAGTHPIATAEVTRRDLTESEELDGTLAYGDTRELLVAGTGTITDLVAPGSIVEPGGVLVEVDGEPVVLLTGERAAWRDLHAGTSDDDDVRQLEQTLVHLDFGTAEDLGPDGDWTSATTRAVKALQAAIGAEEDGTLELGSLVFAPSALRIADWLVDRGGQVGAPVYTVTSTERVVTIDLEADQRYVLEDVEEVEVELPGGTSVMGRITSIADVVSPAEEQGGDPTIEVVVTFDDPSATGTIDQAPVDVNVITVAVEDALVVPVEAVLALAEGGYALERPDGTLVGVELGAFADGFVQITPTTGTVEEGDEVVVAS